MLTRILLTFGLIITGYTVYCLAAEPERKPIPIRKVMDPGIAWPKSRSPEEPLIIKNVDELKETLENPADQATVQGLLDLDSERLVVFHWQGSGQDKLELMSSNPELKQLTTFIYTRGKTRDLRPHLHIYVVPQKEKFNVQVPNK